mmetsp:Transcript_50935/g.94316  ORF Transcript_50935/g.94316 Transcript_50935/m.94316 type:complete len:201 (+) Transcript_50935:871-1473(+)
MSNGASVGDKVGTAVGAGLGGTRGIPAPGDLFSPSSGPSTLSSWSGRSVTCPGVAPSGRKTSHVTRPISPIPRKRITENTKIFLLHLQHRGNVLWGGPVGFSKSGSTESGSRLLSPSNSSYRTSGGKGLLVDRLPEEILLTAFWRTFLLPLKTLTAPCLSEGASLGSVGGSTACCSCIPPSMASTAASDGSTINDEKKFC